MSLSGISLKPLGHDDSGAEYWKLPTSDALFVRTGGARNSDKEDFLRAIGREVSPADSDLRDSPRQWKRLSDVEAIRRLTDLLGDSPRERDLRRNIQQSRVLDSVAVAPTASDCSAVVVAGAVQRENAEACEARDAGEEGHSSYVKKITDAVPAELKLLPNKGQEISSLYVIAEEAAFEQGGGDDSGSGEQDDDAELYFTFSKNRKCGTRGMAMLFVAHFLYLPLAGTTE